MGKDSKSKRSVALPVSLTFAGGTVATILGVSVLGKAVDAALQPVAQAFDDTVIDKTLEAQKGRVQLVMKLASAMGEPWALWPATALVGGRWLLSDRRGDAAVLAAAITGSGVMNSLLKKIVRRPRPFFMVPKLKSSGSSFPSSHMTMSVATYGTMALLVIHAGKNKAKGEDKDKDKDKKKRRPVARLMALTMALCGLIGWSRIYLGVHHPSDVVAGWIAGTTWLLTCGVASKFLAET
ncbi:MAG: undecaprenyl-diphosphatase [Chloroflexia bacterium]|jgi:membrane-associated phospholipid phosphatase|nr:undecaprenyl-diphosphatase [Chloroflexia bacterium]